MKSFQFVSMSVLYACALCPLGFGLEYLEVKGKVQANLKYILMKRTMKHKQNSDNLMKIGQRIRQLRKCIVI